MKNLFLIICLLFATVACKTEDKDADLRLDKARKYTKSGSYSAAKLQIDSIRLLYPKAYPTIKQAIVLMREIETKEQSRNSIYCDSIIALSIKQAAILQKDFVYDQDPKYQENGSWILKSQRIERNLRRSYLRCGVNDAGEMYLVGVYYGAKPISFQTLRVSNADGSFAETLAIPFDGGTNFSFVDGGMTSQIVTFTKKNENGVSGFIRLLGYQRIKIEYLGGKKYSYILDDNTKKAILKTYGLSQVLTDIQRFKQEKKVADAKLIYLAKKQSK